MLRQARELVPNSFDEVPLGVKGLEFIQHPIGSVDGSPLDLISVAQTLVKIKDPLLSPQLGKIFKSGALFVVGHGRADSGLGTVEVSLGPAECA